MANSRRIELVPLTGIPPVHAGDRLASLIDLALGRARLRLRGGDIVVAAQKIVSKAEGRLVPLDCVVPGKTALRVAREVVKDARLVELILSESRRIVRKRPGVLIVEHRLGFVTANAGIDQSNIRAPGGAPCALLLPADPDRSARRLRQALVRAHGAKVGVIINDSFGRAWRQGTVGIALGAAGVASLLDLRGRPDLFGRTLQSTIVGHADEIAAAASLVMGQAGEGVPVVIVRGVAPRGRPLPARRIVRPQHEDLFR